MNRERSKINLIFEMIICLLFLFSFFTNEALAANKYWIGPSGGLTNFTANWSLTSGGAGGAAIPNNYDTVIYNIGGVGSSTVNIDMTVADFISTIDYTGIISIGNTVTLTIGLPSILPALVTVSKTGTQIATTTIPVMALDLGGAFLFTATEGNATTTAIKLKQVGSLSTSTIANIVLAYKNAVGGQCSSTKPSGTTLFGTAGAFDVNGFATTTGTMPLNKDVPVCVYVNYNLTGTYSTSTLGRSIDFEITNPSTDVIATNGTVTTANKVNISGSTIIAQDNSTVSPDPPVAGVSPTCLDNKINSLLSLKMNDTTKNPTVFYLQNCAVWKTEGGGAPVRMTNPNLQVQSLTFTDLTGANSGGTVRIQMTVSNVDSSSGPSYINTRKTYSTTATVKTWGGN
jgi:hypothetical protein